MHWLTLIALTVFAAKPSGPAVVVTRQIVVPNAPSGTLYHPGLPGLKRLTIGGRHAQLLYVDRENNFYERLMLDLGASKRALLQRLVTDAQEGVRGEFRALSLPGRTELSSLYDERFEALAGPQQLDVARFLLRNLPPKHPRTAFYCEWAKRHALKSDRCS